MLFDEAVNFFLGEVGENLDVTFCFLVAHVEPELIESIRRGAVAVEPDVALFSLTKLLAVCFGDEGASEGKGFIVSTQFATNQLRTCGDVTPLVATTHLEFAVLLLVEVEEVVALEQLVGEFGERHTFGKFAIETTLHTVFRHHIVHGDALTNFACKIEETIVFHPFVVVHQLGCIGGIAFKVEEA